MNPMLLSAGAAGGSLGHGLGDVLAPLDLPRQALVNLLFGSTGMAKPAEAEPGSDWMRMLPGLAGTVAGVGSAFVPGLAPFSPAIGAAVGGLAQGAANAINPSNRGASSAELVKALGVDPESSLGGMASMATGLATDPLTYLGAGAAAKGAGAVKGAAEGLSARAAEEAALHSRLAGLGELSRAAETGVARSAAAPAKEFMPGLAMDLERGPLQEYRPEVLNQLPNSPAEIAQLARQGPKTYKRVEPGLSGDLQSLQMASPMPGGGLQLDAMTRPPTFASSRGGWLLPSDQRRAMLAGVDPGEGVLPMPGLQGPPSGVGPLTDPVGEYRSMRASAGMDTPLGQASRPTPSLASLLDPVEADRLYSMTSGERVRAFQAPTVSVKDPSRLIEGHVLQLPVDEAQNHIRDLLSQAMARQQALQSQPLSPLQRLMQRAGV